MAKLTREQKTKVVEALMYQAGSMAEFWDEMGPGQDGVPFEEGRAYLAALMRRMPGDSWDLRLGDPTT